MTLCQNCMTLFSGSITKSHHLQAGDKSDAADPPTPIILLQNATMDVVQSIGGCSGLRSLSPMYRSFCNPWRWLPNWILHKQMGSFLRKPHSFGDAKHDAHGQISSPTHTYKIIKERDGGHCPIHRGMLLTEVFESNIPFFPDPLEMFAQLDTAQTDGFLQKPPIVSRDRKGVPEGSISTKFHSLGDAEHVSHDMLIRIGTKVLLLVLSGD